MAIPKTNYICDLCHDDRSAYADLVICTMCEFWFCNGCISWEGPGAPWCIMCEGSWWDEEATRAKNKQARLWARYRVARAHMYKSMNRYRAAGCLDDPTETMDASEASRRAWQEWRDSLDA